MTITTTALIALGSYVGGKALDKILRELHVGTLVLKKGKLRNLVGSARRMLRAEKAKELLNDRNALGVGLY